MFLLEIAVALLSMHLVLQTHAMPDWLNSDINIKTQLLTTDKGTLRLTNGLIYREFLTTPDFATIDYYSYEEQSSLLRAMGPEAVISLDGRQYNISGVLTNVPRAYLNRTALALDMRSNPSAFHYAGHSTSNPEAPFKYTPQRWAPKDIVWPPKGLRLDVTFKAPFNAPSLHQQVKVIVHYEMYDGIPLLVKWLSVQAPGLPDGTVALSIDVVEYLALNWQWSDQGYKWLHIETDMAHGTQVDWLTDPLQASMPGSFQPIVKCLYHIPPTLPVQELPESFRVQELLHGSSDPERVGLAQRRKLSLLAPQTLENPIFFHMTNASSQPVRQLVDQMSEVGFEMMIYSFKSGFDLETDNQTFIKQLAADISYANSKGIEVGGHDLIVWDKKVPDKWLADTEDLYHGACMASGWYDHLLNQYLTFMEQTGVSMIEADGPYPGYVCHATNHSHHHGYQDSLYQQERLQGQFFKIMHEKGVFINQPDKYFYQGANKNVMGYSEHQYSLPRWQDLSVSRQGMFDDTFTRTATQGWMILPLVTYHAGGGDAAPFEPLSQHLKAYEWGLAQYLGAGVAACYRGYRLYDSDKTKAVVAKWVSFYKKYRDILISDIIHVRRADMQSIDSYMHVNHKLVNKGLAMVFNPTQEHIQSNLTLPLYYTGLTATAKVSEQATTTKVYNLDRGYNIKILIDLPALGITWFLIQ